MHKADDEKQTSNYRPISILKYFSKMYEKYICNQLINSMENIDILYAKQFGFTKGLSTSHAIIIIMVDHVVMILHVDNGNVIVDL